MESFLVIVGAVFLLWLIVNALTGISAAAKQRLLASGLRERQVAWDAAVQHLVGLLRFEALRKEDTVNRECETAWVDLERMTIEFSTVIDVVSHEQEYLLRRTPDGKWEVRPNTDSFQGDLERQETMTAVEQDMQDFQAGTPESDPRLTQGFHEALAQAQSWHQLAAELVPMVEDHYLRLLAILQRFPGTYPAISEEVFVSGAYDPKKTWTPPEH